jgi:hypothetical protein
LGGLTGGRVPQSLSELLDHGPEHLAGFGGKALGLFQLLWLPSAQSASDHQLRLDLKSRPRATQRSCL